MRREKIHGITAWCALFIVGLACLFSPKGLAKPWKGATPGKTIRQQVIDKFGPPTREFSKGGKLADGLCYKEKQAIEGALEANFYFDKNGLLFRIDVFPSREITKQQVVRVFGKDYLERVTRKGHALFNYPSAGMVVFFKKDSDQVHTFMFTEPQSDSKSRKEPPGPGG